ncbi:hypothetical protein ACFPQ7_24915 [Methylobacterium iners]|uniref:hypothetical protein n=1 Tax=Methylobacterium iners TaxID=418707 RepID=UPI003606DB46
MRLFDHLRFHRASRRFAVTQWRRVGLLQRDFWLTGLNHSDWMRSEELGQRLEDRLPDEHRPVGIVEIRRKASCERAHDDLEWHDAASLTGPFSPFGESKSCQLATPARAGRALDGWRSVPSAIRLVHVCAEAQSGSAAAMISLAK